MSKTNEELRYRNFLLDEGKFIPNINKGKIVKKLEPGSYSIEVDINGNFWFEKMDINSDEILDLPSPEYEQVTKEMGLFLSQEVREKFDKLGFIYKRSVLLHGLPGTGKTVIANRVAKDIIKNGGISLWINNSIHMIPYAFEVLNDIQPDTLVGVFLEELDSLAAEGSQGESELLTILDGQVQKKNVVYLGTTNYLEDISNRLYRPGRFSSTIEVHYPTIEARRMYLVSKLTQEFKDLDLWIEKSEGLSIDELKEIVQAVYILNNSLEDTIKRLISTRDYNKDQKINNKQRHNDAEIAYRLSFNAKR